MTRKQWFSGVVCAALAAVWLTVAAGCGNKDQPPADKKEPVLEKAPPDEKKEPASGVAMEVWKTTFENLQQISQGVFSHESDKGFWPVGLLNPKSGRVGLSWRVQILPYLEDPAAPQLYKEFKLDEPWDSDHNKKLIPKMPKAFAPTRGAAPAGHTYYRGFASHVLGPTGEEVSPEATIPPNPNGFLFPDPRTKFKVEEGGADGAAIKDRRLTSLTDGTDNTILVAEAAEAVAWTKPEEIPVRFNAGTLPGKTGVVPNLGGEFDGDAHILFASGRILYVKKGTPGAKLLPFIVTDGMATQDAETVFEQSPWGKERRRLRDKEKD